MSDDIEARKIVRTYSPEAEERIPSGNDAHALANILSQDEPLSPEDIVAPWRIFFQPWENESSERDSLTSVLSIEAAKLQHQWIEFQRKNRKEELVDINALEPTAQGIIQLVTNIGKEWQAKRTKGKKGKALTYFYRFCGTLDAHSNMLEVIPRGNDYVSIFSGTITSIIKASVNHEQIAEQLAQALCDISEHIAECEVELELFRTEEMQKAVADLYTHIFLFLTNTMGWYMRKRRKRLLDSFNENFMCEFESEIENIQHKSEIIKRKVAHSIAVDQSVARLIVEQTRKDLRLGLEDIEREQDETQYYAQQFSDQLEKERTERREDKKPWASLHQEIAKRSNENGRQLMELDSSGAKLNLDTKDNDTDIESFVDSGYGTTSETSSVYFIANAPGAREDILALLLQDEELQILFSSAFERTSAPKFENSFTIMLSQFARELRNEAQDRRERGVAYVVRTMAGYASNYICKQYSPETDTRAREMDQLARQLPHKRQLLERLLNPALTDTEDSHHEETSAEYQGYDAEEDNWDENDMVSLPHLERLEQFVINSQAMNNLRANLRNWINPQHRRSQPPEQEMIAKEPPDMQEPDGQEQTTAYQLPDTQDQQQPPWWRLIITLKRFIRPSVRMGYRRLEWTCDCGEEMYGDYDNRDPVAVEKFASILQQRARVTQKIKQDDIILGTNREENMLGYKGTSYNSGSGGGGGSSTHHSGTFSSTRSEQSGSTQTPDPSQVGSTGTNDSPSNVPSGFGATPGTALHCRTSKRKFLELCVNTGEIDISLGEIDITDVNSDGELFKRIYERYRDLRGHRMRRFFLKPVDVHFIHFSVQGRYRVGIYGQPLVIPPEDEVKAERYHYEECPLKVQPPMDYRTFLHYMKTHKHGDPTNPAGIPLHNDAIFLKRLPKKVGTSMLANRQPTLQFGWGVHIIEGPNKVALSWTTFFGLALSFLVSALYCHFWHTQEQGFAIGQWMVAVIGAAMAALYFQWAET